MISAVENKMDYRGKPKQKLARFVVLNKRVEADGRVFYPGDNVDTYKYPGVKKVLEDGIGHRQRSYKSNNA